MLNSVVYKPNHVLERQKMVQSDHRALWYRLPRSRLYLGVYMSLWTVVMGSTAYGLVTLIRGKPAKKD